MNVEEARHPDLPAETAGRHGPAVLIGQREIGDAMELVTKRRFRHLPIVENGKVLAIVSSGDLTHWLVKDQMGDVQELVDLAAQP